MWISLKEGKNVKFVVVFQSVDNILMFLYLEGYYKKTPNAKNLFSYDWFDRNSNTNRQFKQKTF